MEVFQQIQLISGWALGLKKTYSKHGLSTNHTWGEKNLPVALITGLLTDRFLLIVKDILDEAKLGMQQA